MGKSGRGGARYSTRPDQKKRGPLIVRAALDRETAREIKTLIIATGAAYTPENVAKLIGEWSRAAWDAYEAPIIDDAEAEGYIL